VTTLETIPLPAELDPWRPVQRVRVLADMDAVSHGLAEGSGADRVSDVEAGLLLRQVQMTAWATGAAHCHFRLAASSETAKHHWGLVTASANNQWSIRKGVDGADHALTEELDGLAANVHAEQARKHSRTGTNLVILIGQDHAYGPAIRQLRLLGVPTWVLQPGRYIASDLYRPAACVTRVMPPEEPGSSQRGWISPIGPKPSCGVSM
jgi:hypothetical protein